MKKWVFLGLLLSSFAVIGAEIGELAPELVPGPMLSGNRAEWEGAKGKKIRVLHFWKTESPACASVVAGVNELAERHRGKAVFLSVGAGLPEELRKEESWKKFQCPVLSDALLRNTRLYMDNLKQLPADAVIGADGKLLWTGSTVELPKVLDEVVAGKFDLKASAEADRFNRAMSAAMNAKKYQDALKLLRERRKAFPDDVMLAVGEAKILAGSCKDEKAALALLDGMIAGHPQAFALYQTKIQILQLRGKVCDPDVREVYRAVARAFESRPNLLVTLAIRMMQKRVAAMDLLSVYALSSTAYHSVQMTTTDQERGRAASALARCYYLMGMVDRALVLQQEACARFRKLPEEKAAQSDLLFYRHAAQASAEVRIMEKSARK